MRIKRKLLLFFRKHYKIYTLLVLAIGIALGCTYDGQDDGMYYFNVLGHTFFIGAVL